MNLFDYLLMALVLFSIVAGLMRGLLREAIALICWVLALWAAFHYGAMVEPYLGGVLDNDAVRPWAARVLIFMVVVLVGSIAGSVISYFVRLSMFSGMDRFWGAIFGIVRGLVVVGAFVILCHGLRLTSEPWWHRSLLVPHAERIANILRTLTGERKIEHSTSE
jgi:membrane protein required for colicin V production